MIIYLITIMFLFKSGHIVILAVLVFGRICYGVPVTKQKIPSRDSRLDVRSMSDDGMEITNRRL